MALDYTDLTPVIGAKINVTKEQLLSGDVAADVMALLNKRGVVIFRGIELNDEEHMDLAEKLGTVRSEFGNKIMKVTFDKKENPLYADYFHGTFTWHMDGTWDPIPPLASVLRPQKLATWGGQTEFTNMYAAFEGLSAEDKALLGNLRGVHNMVTAMSPSIPNPTPEQLEQWKAHPQRVHPMVWRHRCGRQSLVLSNSLSHIEGMDPAESKALLDRLWAWAVQPQFVYQHEWAMNDLLIWDNTGTMHRALAYDHECGRRLHRVTLEGIEPLAA